MNCSYRVVDRKLYLLFPEVRCQTMSFVIPKFCSQTKHHVASPPPPPPPKRHNDIILEKKIVWRRPLKATPPLPSSRSPGTTYISGVMELVPLSPFLKISHSPPGIISDKFRHKPFEYSFIFRSHFVTEP